MAITIKNLEDLNKPKYKSHFTLRNDFQYIENGLEKIKSISKEVFFQIRCHAEEGNSEALYDLAACYRFGIHTKISYLEAFKCLQRACLNNDFLLSHWTLGDYYLMPEFAAELNLDALTRKSKAFECFKKAAEKGLTVAQYSLAELYSNKIGIPMPEKNTEESAFFWYRTAADLGLPEAQYAVALCYKDNLGVPKDENNVKNRLKLARKYCEMAKYQWYEPAMKNYLSIRKLCRTQNSTNGYKPLENLLKETETLFDMGQLNVRLPSIKDRKILSESEADSNEKAKQEESQLNLDEYYSIFLKPTTIKFKNIFEDISEASQKIRLKQLTQQKFTNLKRLSQKNFHALFDLGMCYRLGLNFCKVDLIEAFNCIEKAAQNGVGPACYILGMMYYHRENIPVIQEMQPLDSDKLAYAWLHHTAITFRMAAAYFALANSFIDGRIPENLKQKRFDFAKCLLNRCRFYKFPIDGCFEKIKLLKTGQSNVAADSSSNSSSASNGINPMKAAMTATLPTLQMQLQRQMPNMSEALPAMSDPQIMETDIGDSRKKGDFSENSAAFVNQSQILLEEELVADTFKLDPSDEFISPLMHSESRPKNRINPRDPESLMSPESFMSPKNPKNPKSPKSTDSFQQYLSLHPGGISPVSTHTHLRMSLEPDSSATLPTFDFSASFQKIKKNNEKLEHQQAQLQLLNSTITGFNEQQSDLKGQTELLRTRCIMFEQQKTKINALERDIRSGAVTSSVPLQEMDKGLANSLESHIELQEKRNLHPTLSLVKDETAIQAQELQKLRDINADQESMLLLLQKAKFQLEKQKCFSSRIRSGLAKNKAFGSNS